MEIQRALTITGIAIVTYLMFLAWQHDYGQIGSQPTGETTQQQQQQPQKQVADNSASGNAGESQNAAPETVPSSSDVPQAETQQPAKTKPAPSQQVPESSTTAPDNNIHVDTDVLHLQIDPHGGDLVRLSLPKYPRKVNTPNQPFVLLEQSKSLYFVAQSGLVGPDGTDTSKGRPEFRVDRKSYTMSPDQKELNVDLHLTTRNGVQITKRFTFERGSYLIRLSYIIHNTTNKPWKGALYGQLKRDDSSDPGARSSGFAPMPTYLGGAYWTKDQKYNKIRFDDMKDQPLKTTQPGGWIAMVQHYFVAAWVPDSHEKNTYATVYQKKKSDPDHGYFFLRFISPVTQVAPGDEKVLYTELYTGPKVQKRLKGISPGLNMTVDYGWLWFIAQPIFHTLVFLESGKLSLNLFGNHVNFNLGFGVGNWGVSIILLTMLIKLLFFKLSATSYRSMAKMRKVAPEVNRIKEQYKNDRQKQSVEMMNLYKKEKINPLGGCLPMIVQMPVFISLYYVLLETVELRQAPFFGWIHDLSVMDPYFVLPLLMGGAMFLQTRLNPTPPDATQAQIMKWMPIAFTVFFLWFPAGLVLYWLTNNILSITQQYIITKRIERESHY